MRTMILLAAFAALTAVANSAHAQSGRLAERWAMRHAAVTSWHGDYYHTSYGRPVPLVVPPTATTQTVWAWGVAQSEVRPIHHQFRRPFPGEVLVDGANLRPTPLWPSHTDQFGVYYVRGPW
jgi:hypothetical protein